MEALEILVNGEQLLVADAIENKKIIALADSFNQSMLDLKNEIESFKDFSDSQKNGVYGSKIATAKALAKIYEGNKTLRVENAVLALQAEEKNKIAQFYAKKNKVLGLLADIIKESNKTAVVCAFDLFGADFRKCEQGHETIILNGKNTNILETFSKDLDEVLQVSGNFENIEPATLNYNLDTLNRVVEYCTRKNNETYGNKQGKLNKINQIIERLRECGTKVVEFYSFKPALQNIGCEPKGITAYENELSKNYIPLKKAMQSEFRIELEDICNVSVDEESYPPVSTDENTPLTTTQEQPENAFVGAPENTTQNPFNPFDENTTTAPASQNAQPIQIPAQDIVDLNQQPTAPQGTPNNNDINPFSN